MVRTLVEPVYAYDRIVVPAGSKVLGHVERLDRLPHGARLRAILNGDFTPLRRALLQFDILAPDNGEAIPIRTDVRSASEG
jgi:hypothetical protein